MKTNIFLVLMSCLIVTQFFGQTFEEYKKQQESEFAAYKQKQQEFISQMQGEFDEYVKQRDKEFAEYLETQWESFKVFKGEAPPNIPKPPAKPKYIPEKSGKHTGTTKQLKNPLMIIENGKMRPVIPPMIKKSSEPTAKVKQLNMVFYGNDLSFNFDEQILIIPPDQINESEFSDYWLKFNESGFHQLLNQLLNYRNIMNLNDWAYYLLVKKFTLEVYPTSEIGADLMQWALLTRSGYKARIGYTINKTSILLPTYQTLYSRKYLKSDGINFYVMKDLGTDNIHTYSQDYPDAKSIMDFNLNRPLNFTETLNQKSFEFDYLQKHYMIDIDYNKNVIDFYRDYPQVNLDVYFNAAVTPSSKVSIIRELADVIEDMTEKQAIGFLLHFVQTAFNYEVDDKQFGMEKFLFAEETIFYPASDCEDRSVLFAYLVKELLNQKVIGLEYPGHVSTAVKLNQNFEGDRVIFQDEEYIVADATYENAPLGLTMPDFRNKEPKVIELTNNNYYNNKSQSYWDLANQAGGYRGDQLNDIVFDSNGNGYLTGYFINSANFGNYTLESGNDQANRCAFVVKYDNNKKAQWAKRISSDYSVTAYALAKDDYNNLYVAGSFKGEINIGDNYQKLVSKENVSDVFLAKITEDGQLLWIKKAGLDAYPQENYFTYNVKFSIDGVNKGTTLYSENEYDNNFGLSFEPNDLIGITGSFMSSTGFCLSMLSLKTAEVENFNVSESIKIENDKLIEDNYEKTIAGVFSVFNHVKLEGFRMLGTDAQKTLDLYNPDFKEEYTDIYESIGQINFVFNSDGLVNIETVKGKTVLLRELKIKNNARMKVTSYQDGNAKVEVLDGVLVGKFFIWFNLNFIKMFKNTGDLLFDYDPGHSQKLMNLKEDILD